MIILAFGTFFATAKCESLCTSKVMRICGRLNDFGLFFLSLVYNISFPGHFPGRDYAPYSARLMILRPKPDVPSTEFQLKQLRDFFH